MRTRIKVCCISSLDEAHMAVDAGCDAIGLVSSMPSGPGVIDEELIARVADSAPPGVATFLLTCARSVDAVVAQHGRCRTNTIQLCDGLEHGRLSDLRARLPGIKIVQVVHVEDESAIPTAVAAAAEADAILLDSGRPTAKIKELGGTGRVHNWEISAEIRRRVAPKPSFLAGGLTPDNVAAAVSAVRPFGVDTCSGLRRDGKLDRERLAAFVAAVHGADQGTRG